MDDSDDVPRDQGSPTPAATPIDPLAPTPTDPLADALAAEVEEVRRLIDAGAGSPEELRALAERMRILREREASMWRSDVKPELKRARRTTLSDAVRKSAADVSGGRSIALGLIGLAALVLLLVLAASSSSAWLVALPVLGVLGAAWWIGRQPPDTGEEQHRAP